MIPLRDSQRSKKLPLVTILLIAINLIIFLYQSTMGYWELEVFFHRYAFTPLGFFQALKARRFYGQLFSSMFLHGDLGHLIGNMWILWLFGDNVEDYLGWFKYILFYLGTGLIAILAHTISMPQSDVLTLGASGAISGIMGAYLILYPHARILTLIPFFPYLINIPAFVYLILWILLQLFSGILSQGAGGIAWWAHIAGFLGGLLICIGGRNCRARGRKAFRDPT
ncbi:MAG TPA: rhomboid family intramembrane serine protease [Clostridia bacterium]|nr:rhomboid family intramembrane serine protease [Clostridia bacterium]